MILGQPYGRAVDAWVGSHRIVVHYVAVKLSIQALGVLAYEFLCGQEPFGAAVDQGIRGKYLYARSGVRH